MRSRVVAASVDGARGMPIPGACILCGRDPIDGMKSVGTPAEAMTAASMPWRTLPLAEQSKYPPKPDSDALSIRLSRRIPR
jgi:hypothetical protein